MRTTLEIQQDINQLQAQILEFTQELVTRTEWAETATKAEIVQKLLLTDKEPQVQKLNIKKTLKSQLVEIWTGWLQMSIDNFTIELEAAQDALTTVPAPAPEPLPPAYGNDEMVINGVKSYPKKRLTVRNLHAVQKAVISDLKQLHLESILWKLGVDEKTGVVTVYELVNGIEVGRTWQVWGNYKVDCIVEVKK